MAKSPPKSNKKTYQTNKGTKYIQIARPKINNQSPQLTNQQS